MMGQRGIRLIRNSTSGIRIVRLRLLIFAHYFTPPSSSTASGGQHVLDSFLNFGGGAEADEGLALSWSRYSSDTVSGCVRLPPQRIQLARGRRAAWIPISPRTIIA